MNAAVVGSHCSSACRTQSASASARVTHFVQVEERNHNKHPKHDMSNHGAWLITN
jgi:hypothetical protein